MIYDVLFEDTKNFTSTEFALSDNLIRYAVSVEDNTFILNKDTVTQEVTLVGINCMTDPSRPSYEPGQDDFQDILDELLCELAKALISMGSFTFNCGKRKNRINVIQQNSLTHIYTYEYNSALKRHAVHSHPKEGNVFILEEDEVTYTAVPNDTVKDVMEQTYRLNSKVAILPRWLTRKVDENDPRKFVYNWYSDSVKL